MKLTQTNGWFKLYRSIVGSDIFGDAETLKVWIWCLCKAHISPQKLMVGKQKVSLKCGEFIFGRQKASEELNMTPSKCYRIIKFLEKNGNIKIKTNNKFSVISIEKWRFYQGEGNETEQQMNNKRTTNEQQMNTNKECKNVRNTPSISPPRVRKKKYNYSATDLDLFEKMLNED